MWRRIPLSVAGILMCLLVTEVYAGFGSAGGTFLLIQPGAQSGGMAGAFCALADDGMATYHNPAGLAYQSQVNVPLNLASWQKGLYPDLYSLYGSATIPVGQHLTVSPALTYFTTGVSEGMDIYGTPIARWRSYDLAAGLYGGVLLSRAIGVGAGVKVVRSYLAPDWLVRQLFHFGGGKATSFAFDFGVLLRQPLPHNLGQVRIGTALQNLGPSLQYLEGGASDPLPTAIRMGLAYKITLRDVAPHLESGVPLLSSYPRWLQSWVLDRSRICVTADLLGPLVDLSSAGEIVTDSWQSVGVEIAPLAFLAFRLGYFHDSEQFREGMTWGVGIDLVFLRFDFATDSNLYPYRTSNRKYTITLNFGDAVPISR